MGSSCLRFEYADVCLYVAPIRAVAVLSLVGDVAHSARDFCRGEYIQASGPATLAILPH